MVQYLEDVHTRLAHVERLRALTCLRATRTSSSSSGGESEQEPNYEELLNSLEDDLQVVYTVPLPQVREVLPAHWEAAIRKEVENLLATGTVRQVPVSELRALEQKGLVIVAPAKCVFTLKPPATHGSKYKRKCRLVICGNFLANEEETFMLQGSTLTL